MSNDPQTPPSATSRPDGMDSGSQALAETLRGSFAIVKVVMVVLVAVFLFSGIFTVNPQEKAIKLRFGKPVGEGEKALLGAGAHWAWPYPIDEVKKIPIAEIQRITSTVGWYATTPEMELAGTEPPAGASLNPAVDGYLLTADGNIVHARATLSYRIEEPVRYVFEFVNASNAVQNALNNALLHSAARFTADDLLLNDALAFQDAVRRRVAQLVQEQRLGVAVDLCVVQGRPPRQLKQAFDNVVTAGLGRSKALNEARSYESQVINKAGAQAVAVVNTAEADRTRLVQDVTSDAENFRRLLPKYVANPDLFVQQRLVETMARVFTNAQDKMFLPTSADGRPLELRLLLNREPPKRKTEGPGP